MWSLWHSTSARQPLFTVPSFLLDWRPWPSFWKFWYAHASYCYDVLRPSRMLLLILDRYLCFLYWYRIIDSLNHHLETFSKEWGADYLATSWIISYKYLFIVIYSQFIEEVPSYSTFNVALAVVRALPEYSRWMNFLFSFGILKVK